MINRINKLVDSILLEQKQEILSFEQDPIEYIIQKYPSLDATLVDLLTEVYKDYLTGIYVMAPKPTTFKILLHNGHSFYLIYNPKAYICKVSGKKYNLIDLKEEEYAIKAISNLLLLGIPPSSEGPDEEQGNEADIKGGGGSSFASDMTSEPDLGDELDGIEFDGGGEDGGDEPEEELQEDVDNTPKSKKFRIIRNKTINEIKVNKPKLPAITIPDYKTLSKPSKEDTFYEWLKKNGIEVWYNDKMPGKQRWSLKTSMGFDYDGSLDNKALKLQLKSLKGNIQKFFDNYWGEGQVTISLLSGYKVRFIINEPYKTLKPKV